MNSSRGSIRPVSRPDLRPLPGWDDLYDRAACGLLLTESDGTLRLANRTFCNWIGVEREALVGQRRFQDLLSMGGRIFHQTHWAPLLQIQGSVAEVKLDLLHADGRQIPMVMNAVSREHDGVVFHEIALFVAEDRHAYERELLRARRRAEELLAEQSRTRDALALAEVRLRVAMESAALHVWEVDPDTQARRYDPGTALLLGMDTPQAVVFDQILAAVEPADREVARLAFSQLLEERTDLFQATYRLNGVDGVQRTVRATARSMRSADGGKRQVVGLLQDITELSRQRAAAEDRAEFAEQMVGIVSHDLRNPLSTIRVGAQVLQMSGVQAHQLPVLASIDRAIARSQRLISDLLDFTMARIGRGLSINVAPLDLHDVVAQHLAELDLAHPDRALRHLRVGDGRCIADEDRVVQLVDNLVSNAIAYGDPAAPVTVTTSVKAGLCSIEVHNMGPAIPEDIRHALFRPMVRGTDMDAGNRSVGLGLYIVAEIARTHGGDVRVDSSDALGTTFTATFASRPAPRRAEGREA
ncbi:MAG: domain S-box protein [Xanthomonadaceae bacterium]|nr:domain S-box protein [Xanthomonadaceae bacterium]